MEELKLRDCICYNCKHYDPRERDCFNEEYCNHHCRWDDLPEKECQYFSPRKECNHRYEKCYENCSILCHSCPSDRGCEFWFECDLDNYGCDEKCRFHTSRYELKHKKETLSKLYDSKRLMEKLIKEYEADIKEIEEDLKDEDNNN